MHYPSKIKIVLATVGRVATNITNIIFTYLTKVGALLSIIINGLYYALKSSGWPLTCTKNKYEARVTFEGMASFCYVNNIWTAANLKKTTENFEIAIDEDINFVSIRYIIYMLGTIFILHKGELRHLLKNHLPRA